MGIDSISSYGGLYGNYKAQSIPSVDVETVRAQDAQKLANQNQPQSADALHNESTTSDNSTERLSQRSRIANLENVSLTFNQADDFSQIGSEADLGGLDMEKAISDMRKDQVLEQYQYFVGTAQNVITGTNDGVVLMK